MKKSLWTVIMGVVLLLASCQNDDDYQTLTKAQPERAGTSHFYGVKSVTDQTELRGVAQRDKLWNPGTVITVKLLSDPYGMADKIKTYAAEWEQYADIKFDFVTSGSAHVRIGFDWNDNRWVTWSYTGTDCKFIRNQHEATLNFALWDAASEADKRADVLRAFGQVLGLELEHRHLSFDPGWTSRIPEYWESEIEDIPWDELKEYVFDPIAERNLIQTNEYDENSIMIWPFSRKYANNTARDCNYELSEMDKQFINQLYPKEREDSEENLLMHFTFISDMSKTDNQILIYDGLHNDFIIDWGDGTKDTIFSPGHFIHDYQNAGEYKVKIYGPADIIPYFGFTARNYTDFVVEKGCLIESLVLYHYETNSYPHIDVTNAVALKSFSFEAAKSIDLSNNKQLEVLWCGSIQDYNLDLSNNTQLKVLNFPMTHGIYLMKIDISNTLFVQDSVALRKMIDYSLPLHIPGALGTLYTRGVDFTWHVPLAAEKGWIVKFSY